MIVRIDRSGSTSTARYQITAAVAGMLSYDTGPELVPESTLRASAHSLVGRRVTLDHPTLRADGTFAEGRVIGRVLDATVRGDALEVEVEITDPDAIARIDSGDLTEASPGYTAMVDRDDDTGHTVQSSRVYDHLALGGPGWSRCGASCSVSHRIDRRSVMPEPYTMIDRTDTAADLGPIQRHRAWSETAWLRSAREAHERRHGTPARTDASTCARCDDDTATPPPDDGSTGSRESAARMSAWLDDETSTSTSAPPISAAEARERHRAYSLDAWRRPRQ